MKKYLIIATCFISIILWSCDTLDIDNQNSFNSKDVGRDEKLAKAEITNLYAITIPNWNAGADAIGGQSPGMYFDDSYISITSGNFKSWKYENIQSINKAIKNLEDGSLPENKKRPLIGECLFLRAYTYFEMLVYHGGVPYIKVPQIYGKDDLNVKRNTSLECFEYIVKDLDDAFNSGIPDRISPSDNDFGRIDKAFVISFKAKVLLQKASPQFNPKNPYGNKYWAEAYDAAKAAYDFCQSNGIKLMPNYSDVWKDGGCDEEIFTRIYDYPNTSASYYEWYSRPNSLSSGYVIGTGPTWEMIKSYPMLDGKMYDDPSGKYYGGTEDEFMQKYWKNRDPRFEVTVLYAGKSYPVKGTPNGYRQYTAVGIAQINDSYGTNPNAGVQSDNNNTLSGFYNIKGTDTSLSRAEITAFSNDLPVMRFSEVMMIYAEAANENGHSDVSLDLLKQIRKRAGIEPGNDNSYGLHDASDRQKIRDAILAERNIEFCYEGQRFWDLRRTRNLHVLSGLKKHGIESIAIYADRAGKPEIPIQEAIKLALEFKLTPDDFKYVKHQIPLSAGQVKEYGQMKNSYYFFPIQEGNISSNPNIEQNKDWGGTFDPTLD